ncbi:MAG: TlpA disulfide reductase family protein [Bacillota bacterium]|nr:TlpA disulfide reductase family protein [Bacillota bacterium]
MKKKTVLIILLVMGLVFAMTACGGSNETSGSDAQSTPAAGSSVSFQTTDLEGNTVQSEDLFAKNEITMINIWGTFCGPCINEMPELEEINREYADQGVAIVGLLVDVTESDDSMLPDAQEIIEDTGVTYPSLKGWDGFEDQLPAPGVPMTYFVDSSGKLVGEPVLGADVTLYRQTLDDLLQN